MSNNMSVGPGGANQAGAPEANDLQNAALLQAFVKQMMALGKFGNANKYSSGAAPTHKDSTPNESAVKNAIKSDIINHEVSESVTDESQFDSMVTDWVKSLMTTPPDAAKPGVTPPLFRGAPPGGPQGTGNPWAKMPYASILISILMNCMQISGLTSFMAQRKQADMTLAQGQVQREMADLKIRIGEQEKKEYDTQAGFALAQGCASVAMTAVSIGGAKRYANKKYDDETKALKDNPKAADVGKYVDAKRKLEASDLKLDGQKAKLRELEAYKKDPNLLANDKKNVAAELKTLQDSKAKNNLEIEKQKADNEKLANEHQAKTEEVVQKEAQLKALQEKETDLTNKKTENATNLEKAKMEMNEAKKSHEFATKELATARDARNTALKGKTEAERELADNKDATKRAGLEAKVKEKNDNYNTAQRNLDDRKGYFEKKEEALYGTRGKDGFLEKGADGKPKNEGATGKVVGLKKETEGIEEKQKGLAAEKTKVETELKKSKTELAAIDEKRTDAGIKIAELEKKDAGIEKSIEQKNKELTDLKMLGGSATDAINKQKKEIKDEEANNKTQRKIMDKMGEPGINQLNDYQKRIDDSARSSGKKSEDVEDVKKMHGFKTQQLESRTNDPTSGQHIKDNYYRNFTFSMQILDGAAKSILEGWKDVWVGNIKLEKAQLEAQYVLTEAITKLYDSGAEGMRNDVQSAGKNLDGWASFAQQIMQSETDRFGFKR